MKDSNRSLLIRAAEVRDAEAIVRVHQEAVHVTASKDYDAEILNDWSARSDERIEKLCTYIKDNPDRSYMFVAELTDNVVGFAEVVPDKQELRAVYVSPSSGRKGVGKALLEELQKCASLHGASELWLDSSLTAEPFYAANGYISEGRDEHELRSGRKMICVKMRKRL